ncbi:glycine--tRNA ligase subunit beta, partial [Candidatus Desantisbacteria bacterium]|nr:glycine--tRNA ligase subunit beta [Candidatus Desantisbacteria bacterium]
TKTAPKGEYLCIEKHIIGKPAIEVLQENLPGLITRVNFPKSMRWGNKEIRFARPIRWILALLDNEVIPFELGGSTSGRGSTSGEGIFSSNITYGHRFLAPYPITISHPKEYVSSMKKAFVIVDIDKRKQMIASGIREEMHKILDFRLRIANCELRIAENLKSEDTCFNTDAFEDLIDEVTCLVEYPVVLAGGFDEKYLSLPQDVVITSMCEHQRYFPVIENNILLPYFLVVANTSQSPDIVREGNERVLRARLSDAAFFWDSDRKVLLEKKVEQQKKVVWQEKVGTLYEKTQRIVEIAEKIAEELNRQGETILTDKGHRLEACATCVDIESVRRAAWLCKADLLTEMVYEFPTLQGIMGYHYAKSAGETEDVAIAVKEHYLPKSFDGNVPETPLGAIISIADKIDSIVACFQVGLIPTGSEDPYALRRQAQGIINIILKQNLPIDLVWLIEQAYTSYLKCKNLEGPTVTSEYFQAIDPPRLFMKQRLEYVLTNKGFMADTNTDKNVCATTNRGFRADTVAAVLEVNSLLPTDALSRVVALEEIRKMPDIEPLSVSFKRVMNILRLEPSGKDEYVHEPMLKEEAERKLYQSICGIKETVEALVEGTEYLEALKILSLLRGDIDSFFDSVMVMVEDFDLRRNRLALLHSIASLFLQVADLSLLRQAAP